MAAGVRVVPLRVVVDGEEHREDDLGGDALAEALAGGARVTTSQPPPSAFAAAYEDLAAAGATHVVSVHLAGGLSGTADSARTAATVSPVPVHVVDSGTVGLGLGYAVLAAARVARPAPATEVARGAWARWRAALARPGVALPAPDPAAVVAAARATAASARVWFLVDSLEHLRRGGRLGAPAAALGTVLGLRPLLTVRDGRLVVAEKVRTRRAARERLEQVALDDAATRGAVRVGIHHVGPADAAHELAARLSATLGAQAVEVHVTDAGAVLAAHVGPGTLAVVLTDAVLPVAGPSEATAPR